MANGRMHEIVKASGQMIKAVRVHGKRTFTGMNPGVNDTGRERFVRT